MQNFVKLKMVMVSFTGFHAFTFLLLLWGKGGRGYIDPSVKVHYTLSQTASTLLTGWSYWVSAFFTQCSVYRGTGKVEPAWKFKCIYCWQWGVINSNVLLLAVGSNQCTTVLLAVGSNQFKCTTAGSRE